jgi:hypothetical protein
MFIITIVLHLNSDMQIFTQYPHVIFLMQRYNIFQAYRLLMRILYQ